MLGLTDPHPASSFESRPCSPLFSHSWQERAMSEHKTKHDAHAASGRIRLHRGELQKPDTVVKLPNGKTMTLRRSEHDSMPLFRKFNPRKFDPSSGQQLGAKGSPFRQPSRVPFTKFLLTAFLLHQVVGLVRRKFFSKGDSSIVEADEEDEEDEPSALHAELLPAMMRAALPKPQRKSLAQRKADAARTRERRVPSAKQMMGPGKGTAQRAPGMLEKMDKAMRQQVRSMVLAQQRLEEEAAAQYKLEMQQQIRALPAPSQPVSGSIQSAASQPVVLATNGAKAIRKR